MGFSKAIRTCFTKYATFDGRAPRSEYWYFYLFYLLGLAIALFLDATLHTTLGGNPILGLFYFIFTFGVFLPAISVLIRRLHDTGHSGWWFWIVLIPFAAILLLVWFCSRGTAGDNRYGHDPLTEN